MNNAGGESRLKQLPGVALLEITSSDFPRN